MPKGAEWRAVITPIGPAPQVGKTDRETVGHMLTQQLAGVPLWIWGSFLAFVLGMLALDLGVFHRKAHEVKVKEALWWSAFWISLAMLFNVGIFMFWDQIYPASEYSPREAGTAFLTGYLVEKALSVDNLFIFLMFFSYLAVPAKYQHRVLFWGIMGAIVFRTIFIAAGAAMLKQYAWLSVIFGLFLVITGIKMYVLKDKKPDLENNPALRGLRKIMPITKEYHGQAFLTRINAKLWATPLLVALVLVEFTDIIFAIDSIPAIFAITSDPFIVYTSNIFAILGLRSLFFALHGIMGLFRYLSTALRCILVFIGGKMLYTYYMHTLGGDPSFKFPSLLSLGIIGGALALAVVLSMAIKPKPGEEDPHGIPPSESERFEDLPAQTGGEAELDAHREVEKV